MIKHNLFEATIDDSNNLQLNVDIPGGVEINITQANLLELLSALTEITFFCSNLQRGALHDVLRNKLAKQTDKPDSSKEDVH